MIDHSKLLAHYNQFGLGGKTFAFEGMATAINHKPHKDTGELVGSCTVHYSGGEEYLRFADPDDAQLIPDGAWIMIKAAVATYDKNTYARDAVLLAVNGKAIDRSKLAEARASRKSNVA